ncbi:MAG: gluconate 2-dehydrogenase subunit 3 family protein [Chloroflexi bacterium]|nr:gluconate 2-dehydrogenase subunit 3 family protein [Chloroflexota bacterium]
MATLKQETKKQASAPHIVTVLSDDERALLLQVLDCIVPPEGKLLGAGELRIAEYLEGVLAKAVPLRRIFADGLAAIAIQSWQSYSHTFPELSQTQKNEVLLRIEKERPAFFDALVSNSYSGYYSNNSVLDIVYEDQGSPPSPYFQQLKPFDPKLLDRVRARGKLYREV